MHYNRIPIVDMTIKLCPSTNPITTTHATQLHVINNNINPQLIKISLHVSLNILNTLVDMYVKLHKHLDFDGQKYTHVFKCL